MSIRVRVAAMLGGLLVVAGCGGSEAERTPVPADTPDTTAATTPTPSSPDALPPDIVAHVRELYSSPEMPSRYLAGRVDLDEDGVDELLVHVVGPMACGTGGCPTLVYAPGPGGVYRLDATIGLTRPPIRVSPRKAGIWRNLIVEIGGGGGESGHAELEHGPDGYASNPTVPPARRVTDLTGAEIVIPGFASFEDAMPLPGE